MTRPNEIDSRDVIAAINRAGDALLDPRRHAYRGTGARCERCGRRREDHRGWLGRLLSWLRNR